VRFSLGLNRLFPTAESLFLFSECGEIPFCFEGFEAPPKVIGHRSRIIERARMKPDSIGTVAPGLLSSNRQKMFT
jgi:hypothetical protein